MEKWKIYYFNEAVKNEIKGLPAKLKARYAVLTERMIEEGPNLGGNHTKAMGDGVYEIRAKAQEGIARIFYCVMIGKEIWILHSFIKKTQKTPSKELEIARVRFKELTNER
jgi:phage-related protein